MYDKRPEKPRRGVLIIGIVSIFFLFAGAERAHSLTKDEKDKVMGVKVLGKAFVEVAKKVQPAVVNITTEKTVTMRPWDRYGDDFFKGSPFEDFFRGFGFSPREKGKEYRQKQRTGGSGVIVDREGYILTNNHVVEGVDKVKVRLNDGREFTAVVKGQDRRTDLDRRLSKQIVNGLW